MKKIIFASFLLLSILSYSRFVEECRIVASNACISVQSGKRFHFRGYPFGNRDRGDVHRVIFDGKGYNNLRFNYSEYLYY